jgi:hypothetical protein
MNVETMKAMDALSTALDLGRNEAVSIAFARIDDVLGRFPAEVAHEAAAHLLLIQHRRIAAGVS